MLLKGILTPLRKLVCWALSLAGTVCFAPPEVVTRTSRTLWPIGQTSRAMGADVFFLNSSKTGEPKIVLNTKVPTSTRYLREKSLYLGWLQNKSLIKLSLCLPRKNVFHCPCTHTCQNGLNWQLVVRRKLRSNMHLMGIVWNHAKVVQIHSLGNKIGRIKSHSQFRHCRWSDTMARYKHGKLVQPTNRGSDPQLYRRLVHNEPKHLLPNSGNSDSNQLVVRGWEACCMLFVDLQTAASLHHPRLHSDM